MMARLRREVRVRSRENRAVVEAVPDQVGQCKEHFDACRGCLRSNYASWPVSPSPRSPSPEAPRLHTAQDLIYGVGGYSIKALRTRESRSSAWRPPTRRDNG